MIRAAQKPKKWVKMLLIANSTNTTDGNNSRPIGKQKKKKAKPKSILKVESIFLLSDPSVPPQCVLDTLYTTNEENICNFGFTVDAAWSHCDGGRDVIYQTNPWCYFNRLTPMSPFTWNEQKVLYWERLPGGTDIMFKRNISTDVDLLVQFVSSLHHNTLTPMKSLIFQDFRFLQNGKPIWQMWMLKLLVLWNLLKE